MSKARTRAPAAAPVKIKLADLVARSAAGTLTEAEIARSFSLDPFSSTAFDPRLRIYPETVDVAGLETTARDAGHALAMDIAETARARSAAAGPAPNGTIVAEGDSWFRLPPVLFPRTMIDFLAQTYPVDNLAHWGDTLEAMLAAGEYVGFLRAGRVRDLLFSGGGNDLLGDELEDCLNLYDTRHTTPADAAYYLTPFFYERLSHLEDLYTTLIAKVSALSPATRIFVHGYDYVRPKQNGIYLGVHFQRKGLHPFDHSDLCDAIVRLMIDLFNRRLAFLATHHPTFHHVDLRGTVRPEEWFDSELHPKESAAKRLGAKLAQALGPPPP